MPVNVPGALLALGDGEISTGVEIAGKVTLEIGVLKEKDWALPMVVTDEHVITIGSAETLDEATSIAVKHMVQWLEQETILDTSEASMLVSILGDLCVCQAVNPLKTMRVELPRWIAEQYDVEFDPTRREAIEK